MRLSYSLTEKECQKKSFEIYKKADEELEFWRAYQ